MPQEQGSAILSLVGGLLLFVLILFLAWFCTRWISKNYGGGQKVRGRIKVLERTALGPDRSLVIVQFEGRFWLLGVTAHQISKIEELSSDLFEETETAQGEGSQGISAMLSGSSGFADILKSVVKGRADKKEEKDKLDE